MNKLINARNILNNKLVFIHADRHYIDRIVISEIWNCFSRLTSVIFDNTNTDQLLENLKRATHNLERAVLDIYKYIVFFNNKTSLSSEILALRLEELCTSGNPEKLTKIAEKYESLALKIIN